MVGLLLALAPMPPVVLTLVGGVTLTGWRLGTTVAAVVLLLTAALLLLAQRGGARLLATLGVLFSIAGLVPALIDAPGRAFLIGLLIMALLARISAEAPLDDPRPDALSLAKGATLPAILVWYVAGTQPVSDLFALIGVLASGALAVTLALVALVTTPLPAKRKLLTGAAMFGILVAGGLRLELSDALAAAAAALILLIPAFSQPRRSHWRVQSPWELTLSNPAPLLVATFAALSFAGTLSLSLPHASTIEGGISLVDAAFTAVSAACVTGLVVLDTPHDLTLFGQIVVLVLIQIGGLGIMTFSTAALALLRRRASLKHERAIADLLGAEGRRETTRAVVLILAVTVVTEVIGAIVLTFCFLGHGDPMPTAVWRGLFTSISAFCNAGFALQTESLIPYSTDPVVLLVLSLLIVVAGLGPVVVAALPNLARRKPVSTHVRIVLWTTVVLLIFGFVAFTAIEWSNTLGGLTFGQRLANGWFQSVTLRTAGFNSVSFAALSPATLMLMMGLMFIGGSPGSTAGGVKTTTFAILVLSVVAVIRGDEHLVVGVRRVSHRTVYKAIAIITCGILAVGAATMILMLTQSIKPMSIIFEVVSALGTVGLSTGATGQLDAVGKVVIAICMFSGRVGPLTLLLLLREPAGGELWSYPAEDVPVG